MWRAQRLISNFSRNLAPSHTVPQIPTSTIVSISKPALLMSAIGNHQMYNLVKLISTQQLSEQSISDKVTNGLMSLLSQSLPLVNLTSQICSITDVKATT